SSQFDIYITGRDRKNRSQIGKIRIDIHQPQQVLEISSKPLYSVGELGSFDENGVSYPWMVHHQGKLWMYYVGWMPTVLTPFNLQLGLAIEQSDGSFERYSRAPILPRTNEDYLSFGSACVQKEGDLWRMYYTCFLKWGQKSTDHKHYYVIKYAESDDGIHWRRNNHICINIEAESEYSICRPTLYKDKSGVYHLWHTYRGEQYRIGYAYSLDGIHFTRRDDLVGIDVSIDKAWDDTAMCYAQVFSFEDHLYMIYNGNEYGKEGLGLAKMPITDLVKW
ncbi:MAG: hypothetical protein ACPG49_13555, partial [Chitinophagales bacterium]